MPLSRQLLNCLFPRYCLLCKSAGLDKELLCQACVRELPYQKGPECKQCAFLLVNTGSAYCGKCLSQPSSFDQTIALFRYQPPVTQFVARLKFSQQLVYGELMGRLLAERIIKLAIKLPDCLIPVPLHPQRLKERGYNQALCIARTVARILQIPVDHKLVVRQKLTTPQSSLKLKERLANVKNAFTVKQAVSYLHIAMIDDVMTSGQTVNELAKCLKKAGVKKVEVWCVARA